MVETSLRTRANPFLGNRNIFTHPPMMKENPQNTFMNPQLDCYIKHLNDWHNRQMAMGQTQMFHNQMAYQNFMGCIGMPFVRMF